MNTRITKSKISLKSYGETKPKKKGADIASRRANRRVEGTVKAVAETQKKK
jgi:outer membrane protein OmpA-like peptidoglycan-associated protein